jgi:hypothetical protein
MVNATVDNQAVAISLSSGQSTTVPSNETWKVTITVEPGVAAADANGGSSTSTTVSINGVVVAGSKSDSNGGTNNNGGAASATTSNTVPFETVLVGGETVSANSGGARIGGFVVNT